MKNKVIAMLVAAVVMTSVAGCGSNGNAGNGEGAENAETTEAGADKTVAEDAEAASETEADGAEAETDETVEEGADADEASTDTTDGADADDTSAEDSETSEFDTFESEDGWTVKYDPQVIKVEDNTDPADEISFIYTGNEDAKSFLTITYLKDMMPDQVIEELKAANGSDVEVNATGGTFPGTTDKWGYWVDYTSEEEDEGATTTTILGEYNGGTLEYIFTYQQTGDDEKDMAASDALAMVIDSVEYDDFQPQTMFEGVPGKYVHEYTEEIEGEEGTYEDVIELSEDHTGVMSFQDDINIVWDEESIMAEDGSFSYSYTIDGDVLTLDYDGTEMEFTKSAN